MDKQLSSKTDSFLKYQIFNLQAALLPINNPTGLNISAKINNCKVEI
jgi:hypothetical protein